MTTEAMLALTGCVCGKGTSTETCCRPLLRGEVRARTAEELLRSRYAAYVLGEMDYVFATHDPATQEGLDREGSERWSKEATWQGLEIVATERGGEDDSEGVIEFIARFSVKGVAQSHHERAQFARKDGTWFFVDGEMVKPAPVVRSAPKIGRNDPCPCGSGKKHKRCCTE